VRKYDTIGRTYAHTRATDPRIAAAIWEALGDARTVVNVGAGTGNYEPPDRDVTAVEPSAVMIAQRPPEAAPVVQAGAEALPFEDDSFDAAMAVLTIHHWSDQRAGVDEMLRVARDRVVILTFDPAVVSGMWIREYAPEIIGFDREFPAIDELSEWMGGAEVELVPSRNDCEDLFLETLLGRPELVLDPVVRANTSGMARLSERAERRAVERLEADLASGEWDRRYGHLRKPGERDGGMRLVVGGG
jgi:SAM-dependent methyltransferase